MLALGLAAAVAHADPGPVASTERPAPPPTEAQPRAPEGGEPVPADVAGTPVPGDESGRTDGGDPGDSTPRKIARDVLVLPRELLDLATEPVRAGLWAYDRYDLKGKYYELLYNADRTIGVTPNASYQTGYGLSVGGQLNDIDTFGEREHLALEANYGGTYRENAAVRLDSGRRLGRVVVTAGGNFDRLPADPFYGIGNANLAAAPTAPVDPRVDSTAFPAYVRYQEARAFASADVRVVSKLHVIASGALTRLDFAQSTTGIPVGEIYDVAGLVGFTGGVRHAYGELELRWDGRERASIWEPTQLHTRGSYASLLLGEVHRLDGGSDFARYGVDLQKYIHLAPGPRVLVLRFFGEGVTGSRDQVPFTELPYLGGDFLRGYTFDRFRDRVAAFATVQYMWDISYFVDTYLFVDGGRVFPSLQDLTIDQPRVGFGLGVELHSETGFLVEGSIASSIDGGVIFTASFNPLLDERPRWR